MNNVPGDGTRAADYLQRQRYLLLQDFCRPLKSALTALKRGNGADSSGLRRLGGAREQGQCYERSAYGYWLQFEDAGVGLYGTSSSSRIRSRQLPAAEHSF
jgi:hypothetical protein